MAPNEDTPNWHWQQLGYQVERQYLAGGGCRRAIRRPDGTEVQIHQQKGEPRADAEKRAAIAEICHLPHGADECAKAQLDIFHSLEEPAP